MSFGVNIFVDVFNVFFGLMINLYKKFFLFSIIALGLCIFVLGESVQLKFEIVGIGIRHGTPNNLNLIATWNAIQEQEITGQFNDYFRVEDTLGLATGHYTTVQCDGLDGPNGAIITGIYLKAGNSLPVRILGNTGNVLISNILNTYQSIYKPLIYIYKPTDNSNGGKANKYGDVPTIKIVVPPDMTAGTYKGTIVFSLYMN